MKSFISIPLSVANEYIVDRPSEVVQATREDEAIIRDFGRVRDVLKTIANRNDFVPKKKSCKSLDSLLEQLSESRDALINIDYSIRHSWDQWSKELELVFDNCFEADLGLTKELEGLPFMGRKALQNYLDVIELISSSKNSAVRVSKQEWNSLESRLLTLQSRSSF